MELKPSFNRRVDDVIMANQTKSTRGRTSAERFPQMNQLVANETDASRGFIKKMYLASPGPPTRQEFEIVFTCRS